MVNIGVSNKQDALEVAQGEAPQFEKVHWLSNPGLRKLYFWAAVLCVASATTGYDGMLLNTSQNMDQWKIFFHDPKGSKLGLMNAIYQIGSLVSFPLVPYMADWWGRRLPIAIGCAIMLVGALLGTFANGYGMYTGGRFVLGFGNSMAQMASPVLLTEICHPQHRGRVTAIYNCLWNLGALCVAWLAWATIEIDGNWSWRSLTLLQAVPAAIQLTFIYWVPESPRWLVSKERYEEAETILAKYHANGDKTDATVAFEFLEIKETLRLEFEYKKASTYSDFLKTRGNRYRLALLISLGVISQYSGNALFSNYMNLIYENAGIKKQSQKIPLNGGQTLLSLIVSVSCAFLVDRVGRRPLFLTSTSGMVLMFMCWTIVASQYEKTGGKNPKATGYPQIVFVWLFGVFYSLAWSGLLVAYALEILPYKLRAKGIMIMNLTVQATLVLGNYTNAIAWDNLKKQKKAWTFCMFYTIWDFLELIFVYFFYVETRGPTLEELAKIFDGESAEVAHLDLHEVEKDLHAEHEPIDEKRAAVVNTSTV